MLFTTIVTTMEMESAWYPLFWCQVCSFAEGQCLYDECDTDLSLDASLGVDGYKYAF